MTPPESVPKCDCGQPLTLCADCAIAEHEAAIGDTHTPSCSRIGKPCECKLALPSAPPDRPEPTPQLVDRPPTGWPDGPSRVLWNLLLDEGLTIGEADAFVGAFAQRMREASERCLAESAITGRCRLAMGHDGEHYSFSDIRFGDVAVPARAHQERTEPTKGEERYDDLSVQPRVDRSEAADDRASALLAGDRESATRNEAWHDVRVPELRREAVAEHERIDAETAKKLHVLVAEIRRCIGDDHLMAAHRKLDAIDELLRGAPARAAEWQPIETAPKDGTLLILSNGSYRVIGYWGPAIHDRGMPSEWTMPDSDMWRYVERECGFGRNQPTMWAPVPLPPCALTGRSEKESK